MAKKFSVKYVGMDGRATTKMSTLLEVQQYVKDRWEGADYIRGFGDFHNDYGYFILTGCKLSDLGKRRSSDPNDPDYWEWEWVDLNVVAS